MCVQSLMRVNSRKTDHLNILQLRSFRKLLNLSSDRLSLNEQINILYRIAVLMNHNGVDRVVGVERVIQQIKYDIVHQIDDPPLLGRLMMGLQVVKRHSELKVETMDLIMQGIYDKESDELLKIYNHRNRKADQSWQQQLQLDTEQIVVDMLTIHLNQYQQNEIHHICQTLSTNTLDVDTESLRQAIDNRIIDIIDECEQQQQISELVKMASLINNRDRSGLIRSINRMSLDQVDLVDYIKIALQSEQEDNSIIDEWIDEKVEQRKYESIDDAILIIIYSRMRNNARWIQLIEQHIIEMEESQFTTPSILINYTSDYWNDEVVERLDKWTSNDSNLKQWKQSDLLEFTNHIDEQQITRLFAQSISRLHDFIQVDELELEDLSYYYVFFERHQQYWKQEEKQQALQQRIKQIAVSFISNRTGFRVDQESHFHRLLNYVDLREFFEGHEFMV